MLFIHALLLEGGGWKASSRKGLKCFPKSEKKKRKREREREREVRALETKLRSLLSRILSALYPS